MKILIHADEYYPTCAACAYRMKAFSDEFTSKGNEVTVIASSTNKKNGIIECCNEKIIFAPTVRMKKKTTLMRMINNMSFAITSVVVSLWAGKADVVITTSPPPLVSISGWIIAKLKGAKLIYDVRDVWPDVALEMNSFSETSVFYRVFKFITDFMYKHSDLITTVSPGKVEKIRQKLPGRMRDKVVLIGNGFDEKIISNDKYEEIIDEYNLKEHFTCVYVGNIGLAQGLDVLLDVATKTGHKDVQFLLFGTGAEKEQLEKRAIDEGLKNVHFCGVLPHDKVYTLLTEASMSFVPLKSSKMRDSIPTKIYESLGVGCPVFLVAEGDSCDIVNETGLGRCVSPDSSEVIIRAFDEMIDEYSEILHNKEAAINLMKEKYSRQHMASNFEKLLREMID